MGKKSDEYLQQTLALCDERKVWLIATATKLPRGEFGMCLLTLNGNNLDIYDVIGLGQPGDFMYSIPLSQVEKFECKPSWFNEFFKNYCLRFVYNGKLCSFKNCCMRKEPLSAIAAEAQKAR